MKITIEPTSKIVHLVNEYGISMPARIWEGFTDRGTPVHCFVTRIAPTIEEPLPYLVAQEFDASLQETRTPSIAVQGIPLRLIL